MNDQPAPGRPRTVTLPPQGNFVYVPDFDSDVVHRYSISETGQLESLSSMTVGNGPRTVVFDPGGKFAYIPLNREGVIRSYSLQADGTLVLADTEPVTGGPFDFTTTP